ncbi:MAG: PorP/SprF family type IX secretion system membrane protein [Cytophagaceae bacterium]|jgi:type IX secretion system PorP/SprF family membrane protein|nr:PorP/SprF family type IX secretion system membrane protein [Cytophagaceae bacterium]
MKRFIFIILLLLVSAECIKAQDVSFSQVYSSPLYLSPSFSGFTSGGRVIMNYRDQWPNLPNTFRSFAFSYDQYVGRLNSGLGLLVLHDDQGGGQLITQNVGVVYAYELAITSDIFVRPGLQFKYAGQRIDPSKMLDVDVDGNKFPWLHPDFPVDQYHKLDASASLMVYSDLFWLGATVDHLVKNDVGFTDIETRIPIKITGFGGGKWQYIEGGRGRSPQSVSLAFMYRRQQSFQQLDLGAYWNVEPLEVGLWYRGIPGFSTGGLSNNDAVIFSLGVNIANFHIAYSYDLTLSDLAGYSGGSNEFSLIWRFSTRDAIAPNRGAVPCGEPSWGLGETTKYRTKKRSFF